MRTWASCFAACAAVAAFAAGDPGHSGHGAGPYAGQQARDVKALSADEVSGYLSGAGMGFAKAAELNGYPGPMHTEIAAAQGRVRASHLKAHLETTALLTPGQVGTYNRLRGYAGGS